MKKIIAIVLALVLSVAMMIPVNAAGDVYMIFAAETDDGCGIHPTGYGRLWGPVGENADLGHPAPVQGETSYCVNTDTSQTVVFHNMTHNPGVTTTGIFDATGYEFIELDIYCHYEIIFNWSFGLASNEADPAGASYGVNNAWLPGGKWTHIKMPIDAFGGFPAQFPGSMSTIRRIKMELLNIVDCYNMENTGETIPPNYTYVYFDNVIATRNGAGSPNELITLDEVYTNPPEWYDDYRAEYVVWYEEGVIEPPTVIWGDANEDEEVTAEDALAALQHSVGKIELTGTKLSYADVNADGEVTAEDALFILQFSVDKIDKFPREVSNA